MKTVPIQLSTHYVIYLENNLLTHPVFYEFLAQLKKRLVIITDDHLKKSLGKRLQQLLREKNFQVELLTFPSGEIYKTRETKQLLEDALLEKHYGRDTCLIALGGGVVSDLVGFLASTFCRGIPVIYIPTTLLAMVDASIGGKTGVNTAYGKNLIGTFSQPKAVFMDTSVLATLPEKEWQNGMVEIIKHGMIADESMIHALQNHRGQSFLDHPDFLVDIIYHSCVIKKNIVEQDEKEIGMRQLLNFGHTIGHAIELLENYQISHGHAVAIGMLVESYLSVQCGFLSESVLTTLDDLLQLYHIPLQTKAFENIDALQKKLMLDKKAIANLPHFVLLKAIGKPYVFENSYAHPVDLHLLEKALNWAAERFQPIG